MSEGCGLLWWGFDYSWCKNLYLATQICKRGCKGFEGGEGGEHLQLMDLVYIVPNILLEKMKCIYDD